MQQRYQLGGLISTDRSSCVSYTPMMQDLYPDGSPPSQASHDERKSPGQRDRPHPPCRTITAAMPNPLTPKGLAVSKATRDIGQESNWLLDARIGVSYRGRAE